MRPTASSLADHICRACQTPLPTRRMRRQFCSNACQKDLIQRTAVERFWGYVNKTDECWLWMRSKTAAGYGLFGDRRQLRYAHRYSYELTRGPIPDGLVIDHLCRNPACVNPAHLEPVNSRRKHTAGRGS